MYVCVCRAALELQYKVCVARILDSKRKFVEAASNYHDLSHLSRFAELEASGGVATSDILIALSNAAMCAILAGAGPQRSRVLTTLYKDERCATLEIFPILEKVHLERLLTPEDTQWLQGRLKEHHKAVTEDGGTVLDRAVIEHNLVGASRLYSNIHVEALGELLGVSTSKAEDTAAKMVSEGRMFARIDQVDGLVHFMSGPNELARFDEQIQNLCLAVNDTLQKLPDEAKHHAKLLL